MSDSVKIDHRQIDAYARAMKAAPQKMKIEIPTAINRITVQGQGRSRRYVKVDTGRLRNSIATEPARQYGGGWRGTWGTNVDYARPVEEGRRAGAAMPPAGALLPWMNRHGIPADAEYVVRRAIARSGIEPNFFMRRARQEIRPIANRELKAAVKRVLDSIRGRR